MLPILYQSPNFVIYSYPLFMGLAWGVAYQFFFSNTQLSLFKTHLMFWGIFLSAWMGAKIFFLITSGTAPVQMISELSFWTGGGFVFAGGLILGSLYLILFHFKVEKINQATISNLVLALVFGHGIGRIGCFLAGCCFGRKTSLWTNWGLHFSHHPTQLLECLGLLLLGAFMLRLRKGTTPLLPIYLFGYGLLRFGIEFLRGDAIRGTWGILTPSQWVAISMFLLSFFVFSQSKKGAC